MPDCEHPSPAGCYTCLSDRQLRALTAEHLCQILETGIPPSELPTDVNIVSSVVLSVTVDNFPTEFGRSWTLDFPSDQVDATGSVVALDAATLTALETVTANQGAPAILPWRVQPAPNNLTVVETTVTASGDTVVYTPAVGNAIRLYWVYAVNDPDQLTTPLIRIKIGASAKYRAFAVAKAQVFEGAANEQLVVELGSAGSVAFTAHIQEFTP